MTKTRNKFPAKIIDFTVPPESGQPTDGGDATWSMFSISERGLTSVYNHKHTLYPLLRAYTAF
jgi:hypothetical protein